MPRAKIQPKRKHVGRGVSLSPDMQKAASRRAATLDISFSRYVQKLIESDLKAWKEAA